MPLGDELANIDEEDDINEVSRELTTLLTSEG
jgi:hypothetical protein